VALAATASDPDGIERVEFVVNGSVIGVDDVAPYTLDWDSTTVADGDATITARATDFSSAEAASTSRTVRVDNHAPDTTILSGPSASTTQTSATLTFSASEAGASFRCRLDVEAPAPCSSPVSYSSLLAGEHRFEVAAVDAAGNADPSPAERTWTVAVP
jgi:large repetitive protein